MKVLTPEHDVWEPQRAPSVHSDVIVPLWQAVATAIFLGLLPTILVLTFTMDLEAYDFIDMVAGADWRKAFVVFFGVFAVIAPIIWFWRMGWAAKTVERVESYTGLDINQDGEIGEPPAFVSINQYGSTTRHNISPQSEKERVLEFIRACYQGNTSITTLQRVGFTEREIDRFRAILMRPDVGAARWKNPNAHNLGWQMVKPQEDVESIIERGIFRESKPGAEKGKK